VKRSWRLVAWALSAGLSTALVTGHSIRGQQGATPDAVSRGHHLAVEVCSICHLAAPDQEHLPLLRPPAPPFEVIAQRKDVDVDYLRKFLTTTHRDLKTDKGMPNPLLADFQVSEVTAYILSLRK
jgi:mono/diheme cytochrome c family protein